MDGLSGRRRENIQGEKALGLYEKIAFLSLWVENVIC